jgi:hypothetical protein
MKERVIDHNPTSTHKIPENLGAIDYIAYTKPFMITRKMNVDLLAVWASGGDVRPSVDICTN